VLLALAWHEWLGPVLFHLASPLVLQAETSAVQVVLATLGGFSREGLVIAGSTDHGIVIEEGCSAFHNLSLSTLIWISLIRVKTLTMKSVHFWLAAAMAAPTIILNTVRIGLMAQSYPMYDFWHNGTGVPIVSFTMLAVTLGICLCGLKFAEGR
jgi:hypothetical protein